MSADSLSDGPQRVWLPVKDDDSWVLCTCTFAAASGKTTLTRLHGKFPDTNSSQITMSNEEVAKLRPAHGDLETPASDLVWLEDVHECTMLHNLRLRYAKDKIYTAIGPVLLAINPYKKVGDVLGYEHSLNMEVEAPPHCNKTSRAAYAGLLEGTPQSILISGESGAGKTETNKICMSCLAQISNSTGVKTTEQSLQAGILLEAFGNARTVYNNNSSRFGKWCAVFFDTQGKMSATQVKSYLLEKSRVVGPSQGERNYHIFYQMVAGASADERKAYALQSAHGGYRYLQGEASADGIDDVAEWASTKSMLGVLGFSADHSGQLFALYAAVLALGNVTFEAAAKADTFQVKDSKLLETAATLLQVPPTTLAAKLTTRVMTTVSSSYTVPLTEEQCADTRDALAKAVYVGLFDWLIARMNARRRQDRGGRRPLHRAARHLRLRELWRQRFRAALHQLHQREAAAALHGRADQARAGRVRARGHQGRPHRLPRQHAADRAHRPQEAGRLRDARRGVQRAQGLRRRVRLQDARRLRLERVLLATQVWLGGGAKDLGEKLAKLQFIVTHYAGPVQYTAHEWLEKNRGTLHPGLSELMASSDAPGMQVIFQKTPEELKTGKKQTVGAGFRASLRALSATMLMTTQHFIRCVKPNGDKKPDAFNGQFVQRQLKYTGVHSVVDIHRAGYPIKFTMGDFVKRYRCIAFDQPRLISDKLPDQERSVNLLNLAHKLATADPKSGEKGERPWLESMRVQLGKTRVFMRGDIVKHIEKPRHAAQTRAAICVQRYARTRLIRRVAKLTTQHKALAGAVKTALAGEEGKTTGRAAAMVQRRLDDAGALLDRLLAVWQKAAVSPEADPTGGLLERKAELSELEVQVRSTQTGLLKEKEAVAQLERTVADTTGSSKQAFVALKTAVAVANEASRGLTEELEAAIASVEAELASRFAEMLKQWEAEAQKIAIEREAERKKKQAAVEAELLDVLRRPADVEVRTLTLRNGKDGKGFNLSGYTLEQMVQGGAPGVTFDGANSVSIVVVGGAAARDNLLRVGDTVLCVDDAPLLGEKVSARMDAKPSASYKLTIARRKVDVGASGEEALPMGDKEGWMYLTKAEDGGNKPLHAPKKCWAVLLGEVLVFHEEVVRGQERVAHPQPLKGSIVKVPMSKKLTMNKAGTMNFDTQSLKLNKSDAKALGRKEVERLKDSKIVAQQRQKETTAIEQTAAVAELLQRKLAPFRLTWPDGELAYDLVCAVDDAEARTDWQKALQGALDRINANAPTSGWLEKQKGRGGGMAAMTKVLGWDKRWFVLTQPEVAGELPRFEYFERPGAPVAKGSIALNKQATLLVSEQLKSDNPFGFCVTSQGPDDKKPITTTLAATKGGELDKWTMAIRRAIRGEEEDKKAKAERLRLEKAEADLFRKTPEQLQQLLDYMGKGAMHANRSVKDKGLLVQCVVSAREASKAGSSAAKSGGADGGAKQLRDQMSHEEAQLGKRTVEELKALLEFMEVDFDDRLEDKHKLISLVVRQKNLQAVAQSVAPGLLKWKAKSASRVDLTAKK